MALKYIKIMFNENTRKRAFSKNYDLLETDENSALLLDSETDSHSKCDEEEEFNLYLFNRQEPSCGLGVRHLQVFLIFLLIFLAYGIRSNLSVGIVAMTDPIATNNPNIPTYPEWHDKSIVLSSFFWGYIIPQIGAGYLAKTYGAKWFLVASMAFCSIFGVLIPALADLWGSKGVMLCRLLQGFSQGFIFPSVHDLLSKWVPVNERSRLGSFVYAGGSLGTVVSLLSSGYMAASWWGWPSIFYVYGAVGMIWVVLMILFGSNSPAEHETITKEERQLIEGANGNTEKMEHPTPWLEIFKSKPFWALLITHCGQNWGFWTLMTEIPTYMSSVLKFDMKSNSTLSSLPYLTLWLLNFVFSYIADMMYNRGYCSLGATRKIFNSIGLTIPAIALVFLGYSTAINTAIALLIVAVGVNSAIYCGFNVNHMDLSPNHSGTLMGLTNCVSNIFSLLAPLYVQVVILDETDSSQWAIVFVTAAVVYFSTNLIFVIFGSGEIQPWNDYKGEKENKTQEDVSEKKIPV